MSQHLRYYFLNLGFLNIIPCGDSILYYKPLEMACNAGN